jgi:release factor glutamine methyltransferase
LPPVIRHSSFVILAAMKPVLEVLQSTTTYFQQKKIDSPRLNIEHLLAHVLGKTRMDLYLEFDRPLGDRELDALRELVRRRASGVPLQHLLGTVEFHGRTFASDARALIPRPETEQLVELLLQLPLPPDARCVDVGTGSGVIALTLAAERPLATIAAVDVSPAALELARENAERVQFHSGSLLEPCPGTYDLIAANLPYIATADIAGLAAEVRHDPVSALDGGSKGLDLIAVCITQAPAKLNPGGWLALEIGASQAGPVRTLLGAAGFGEVRVLQDYQGIERFVLAPRG